MSPIIVDIGPLVVGNMERNNFVWEDHLSNWKVVYDWYYGRHTMVGGDESSYNAAKTRYKEWCLKNPDLQDLDREPDYCPYCGFTDGSGCYECT